MYINQNLKYRIGIDFVLYYSQDVLHKKIRFLLRKRFKKKKEFK